MPAIDTPKRFKTRDVQRVLVQDGILTDRERIARISDRLGIGSRGETEAERRTWDAREVALIRAVYLATTSMKLGFDHALDIVIGGEDRLSPIREAIRQYQSVTAA